jgi:hypothetical protein
MGLVLLFFLILALVFASDRTIAEYAADIWGSAPARWTDVAD